MNEKKFIEKRIFRNTRSHPGFTWKDIKHIQFEDDDIIKIGWENEAYYSDSSHDAYYYAEVTRKVLETDEQYQKRLKDQERDNIWAKERRLESYLKLKQEFENELPVPERKSS